MTAGPAMSQTATGRTNVDLRIYLVTDSGQCGDVGVPTTVAQAVAGGATIVQLRDPQADDRDLVELGRRLVRELDGSGVPLIVNDRVELVPAIGAAGAHVGQGDVDPVRARAQLGPDAVLGLSVQTLDHVRAAVDTAARGEVRVGLRGLDYLDYLGVGPVWPTGSKSDAATPGGLGVLADIVTASPWPCVAIGGIDLDRVPAIRDVGAAGVAVISAVCGQPDVTAATRALRAAWEGAAGAH